MSLSLSSDFSLGARVKRVHRLFARKLLPLTGRRLDLLAAFGLDQILSAGGRVDRIILREVALVLSISDPQKLYRRLNRWHPLTILWRLRTILFRDEPEAKKLAAYLDDYTQLPDLWRQSEQSRGSRTAGRQLTAPWLLSQCLIWEKTFPGKDGWEHPVDLIAWELATLAEAEGGNVRFVTQRDRDVMQQVKDLPAPDPAAVEQYRQWKSARAGQRQQHNGAGAGSATPPA